MTDYSKMSDFEINKAVAEELHGERLSLIVKRDVPNRPAVTVFADIGNGEVVSIVCADYCNNPADAWPIIQINKICITHHAKDWEWHCYANGLSQNVIHKNPLRAAMIVFLMMKEAEK